MKKVFDLKKMKCVKRGAKKKFVDVRIYLDTNSVFFEGGRVDEHEEEAILKVLQVQMFKAKLDNGYVPDTGTNRDYLKWLVRNRDFTIG